MSVQVEGIEQLSKALQNVAVQIGDAKTKRKVLRKAGNIVRDAARTIAPKNKTRSASYRYNTPKVSNKLRAPKGFGKIVAKYLKGNLAGAIQIINLRRTGNIIVGPKVNKRGEGKGVFGPGTRRFDAYYAQMIFGSALAFRRKVMRKALMQTKGQATSAIEMELERELKAAAQKNGLDVR